MTADETRAVALLQRMLGAEPLRPSGGVVEEQADGRGAEEQHRDGEGAGCRREHDEDAGEARQGRPAPGMPAQRADSHVRSVPRPGAGYTSEGLLARVRRPDYGRWLTHAQTAGGCVRPVRLRPSMLPADPTMGELTPAGGESPDMADGVIYKACGDRRASCARPARSGTGPTSGS